MYAMRPNQVAGHDMIDGRHDTIGCAKCEAAARTLAENDAAAARKARIAEHGEALYRELSRLHGHPRTSERDSIEGPRYPRHCETCHLLALIDGRA